MDRRQQNDYLVKLIKKASKVNKPQSKSLTSELDMNELIKQSEADTEEYINKRRMLG